MSDSIEYLRNGYAVERNVVNPKNMGHIASDERYDRLFQTANPELEFYIYPGLPLEAFYTISMLWHLGFSAGMKHGREQQRKEIRQVLGLPERT